MRHFYVSLATDNPSNQKLYLESIPSSFPTVICFGFSASKFVAMEDDIVMPAPLDLLV